MVVTVEIKMEADTGVKVVTDVEVGITLDLEMKSVVRSVGMEYIYEAGNGVKISFDMVTVEVGRLLVIDVAVWWSEAMIRAEVSIDLQVCLCLVVDLDLTVRLCLMVVDGVMG